MKTVFLGLAVQLVGSLATLSICFPQQCLGPCESYNFGEHPELCIFYLLF